MVTSSPPRWAVVSAHFAALTPLPSGLWRIALAVGLPVGYSASETRELFDVPGAGAWYLIGLSLVLELLAFLTLGLVQPWDERTPRWFPVLGGRALPHRPVVIASAIGAVALSLLWVPVAVLWWFTEGDGYLTGEARVLVGLTYLPLAAWGALLGAVAWSYHRRR